MAETVLIYGIHIFDIFMNRYPQSEILKEADFSKIIDGKEVKLIRLSDAHALQADITNYGGKIVTLITPDRDGKPVDVVLGHDTFDDYYRSEEQYFGSLIGRYGNRIAGGVFKLDGETYRLHINNGPNSLHGGVRGWNNMVWDIEKQTEDTLVLSLTSPDGDEGFPGEVHARVTYALKDGALDIAYEATTTKPTVLNLTNHSYFNLNGEGDPTVHDHLLKIYASHYLPTNETAIPFREAPAAVKGTPFDFLAPHTIGERIDTDIDQLSWARGYDHTFVLDKEADAYTLAASCLSPRTGIRLDVMTTEPGMQVYTGNWMSGNMRGKGDSRYPARSAVCFETQHYPDTPNRPDYPSAVLRPGETFKSRTSFRFSVSESVE